MDYDEGYVACVCDALMPQLEIIELSLTLYGGEDIFDIRREIDNIEHNELFCYFLWNFASSHRFELKTKLRYLLFFEDFIKVRPPIVLRSFVIVLMHQIYSLIQYYQQRCYAQLPFTSEILSPYLETIGDHLMINLISGEDDISMRVLLTFYLVRRVAFRLIDVYEERFYEMCHVDAQFWFRDYFVGFQRTGHFDDEGIY